MSKLVLNLSLIAALSACFVPAHASLVVSVDPLVLGDDIVASPEFSAPVTWGDGSNDLFALWSQASENSAYIYTSEGGMGSANVYNAGVIDPLSVVDASLFSYASLDAVEVSEGETVFFQGLNGYYGAWIVDDVFSSSGNLFLSGRSFFQAEGGTNFAPSVPEPGTLAMVAMGVGGLLLMALRRRTT